MGGNMIPNCTKRKHESRIHELLSNGQWLNLYFKKCRCNPDSIPSHWNIGLCISKTVKQANDWFEGKHSTKLNNKQTGRVGLEGLNKAFNYIMEFGSLLRKDEVIWIEVENEKRVRAYKRLLKYPNWDSVFVDETTVYIYSNPKYWKIVNGVREEI
jgi:hypothetical protein